MATASSNNGTDSNSQLILPFDSGCLLPQTDEKPTTELKPASQSTNPKIYSAEFARIETSMLYLPFFALGTRDLKSHKGINVESQKKFGDTIAKFTFRVSGNKEAGHPGNLSRKIHHALMAKLQEDELLPPYRKPIAWEWSELNERIGWTSRGGRNNEDMKNAIKATLGATITTNLNLYELHSKALPNKKESGFHLYEKYVFAEEKMPDGSVADSNYLWVAGWYLANMNNNYVAPIDYNVWRLLDVRPTASRLYEYLIYNFAAGQSVFKIAYAKLCMALPIVCERYRSQAEKQLNPHLQSLRQHHVIDGWEWEIGAEQQLLLKLLPGSLIGEHRKFLRQERSGNASLQSDAVDLVRAFHRKLRKVDDHTPTKTELEHAHKVLEWLGADASHKILPRITCLIQTAQYDCQWFGGSMSYWEQQRGRIQQRKKDVLVRDNVAEKMKVAEQQRAEKRQRQKELLDRFEKMPEQTKTAVLTAVEEKITNQTTLRKFREGDYALVRSQLISEIEKRL